VTETKNFRSAYAATYDVLYHEKDYEAECDFIENLFRRYSGKDLKNLLDIGCGTGGHAIPLARRGYSVYGIDRSPEMIAIAEQKAGSQGLSGRTRFKTSTIQDTNLEETFDAVICMFAVIGYQTSNAELFAALQTARRHLKLKGLFICDFWYGPAVLKQRPTERIKTLNADDDRIIRIARPDIDIQKNLVTISYHLLRLSGVRLVEETQELHQMRYLFQPETEFFLSQAKMKMVHFCPFMEIDGEVNDDTWNVTVVARAV
jgi:SAM-dependent methyltransferase